MSFPSVKQNLVRYLANLQENFKERFPELEEGRIYMFSFHFELMLRFVVTWR